MIGGVAVGFHGYVRATKDVDIVPAPDPANLERLAHLLRRLDAEVEGADEFEVGDEALWERLSPAALDTDVDGLRIKIVSYDDLVALKKMAGRAEDITDLQRLRQARGEKSAG